MRLHVTCSVISRAQPEEEDVLTAVSLKTPQKDTRCRVVTDVIVKGTPVKAEKHI